MLWMNSFKRASSSSLPIARLVGYEQDAAVLFISHDLNVVQYMSDRVMVMHEGRITGILSRPECSEEAIMRLAVGHGSETAERAGAAA